MWCPILFQPTTRQPKKSMFIPFLAASVIAAVFANMGAMAVKISVLSMALKAMIALCIVFAALSAYLLRKA